MFEPVKLKFTSVNQADSPNPVFAPQTKDDSRLTTQFEPLASLVTVTTLSLGRLLLLHV